MYGGRSAQARKVCWAAGAMVLYRECGMMWIYFSPSDPEFLQVKDAYSRDYRGLGYRDASGTLYYRVKGFIGTKEQFSPVSGYGGD